MSSPDWTRTSDKSVNSRLLYQLSYRGSRDVGYHPLSVAAIRSGEFPEIAIALGRTKGEDQRMRTSVENLLSELPGAILPGSALAARRSEARWEPTGLSVLDERIGGGLPVGRCSEIFGSLSGGATNLAFRLLSQVTTDGRSVGWVDPGNVFDAEACTRFGGRLSEVLQVRPRSRAQALDAAELLLQSGDFPLVILDLQPRLEVALQFVVETAPQIGAAVGVRLSRAAARHKATLVLLSGAQARLQGVPAAVRLECCGVKGLWASGLEERSFLLGLKPTIKVHRSPAGGGFGISAIL